MTTVSIGDCIKDTGYLAEYTNVDFIPLPKNNASEVDPKKPEKAKSESEEENENLKSQIDDLTKARIQEPQYLEPISWAFYLNLSLAILRIGAK